MKIIDNLQIVRGLASTSVVYYHAANYLSFGSFGVDIFFVLSGFVIAMLIETGQTPVSFLVARLSRVLPLYWLLTLGLFFAANIVPGLLNSATANTEQLVKSLLFIPFFRENGDMFPLLGVGWTLNYEMLFYGCTFLTLFLSQKNWILITALLFFAGYAFLGKYSDSKLLNQFLGNALIFEFLLGVYAFKIYNSKNTHSFPSQLLLVVGVFAYMFMALVDLSGIKSYRLLLLGVPSVFLVLAAVELEKKRIGKISSLEVILVNIGNASYATYLSHYFVVATIKRVLDPGSATSILLTIVISLLIGQLIYYFIDNPMHKFFKRNFNEFFLRFRYISKT